MRLVSARSAAPYLFALLLSSLIDLLLRARLLFDLYLRTGFDHSFTSHSLSAQYLRFSAGIYFLAMSVFLIFFIVKILPIVYVVEI